MIQKVISKPLKAQLNSKIMQRLQLILFVLLLYSCTSGYPEEDGHRLWLPIQEEKNAKPGKAWCNVDQVTANIAVQELEHFFHGKVNMVLNPECDGKEGTFKIEDKGDEFRIASSTPTGLLYGAYHLIRLQKTGANLKGLNIREEPAYDIRILNHWDNLDGSVERGYAGTSLWKWNQLPDTLSTRYQEYARANASIGINAVVLNNVNASPDILTTNYLKKVSALADVFRPYGIKVYLSVNFASPKHIGNLNTSDPFNSQVYEWWKTKVDEIYAHISDFGGFLVKANSEGQSGPQDYGRTHADGANMLADALEPYGGIVMWRAFVYAPNSPDRASQAYEEFVPLDGEFASNVIIQIKNGPVDFQPREPFSPLFGATPNTAQMVEFQITQEYLGFSNHLVYLAPLWKECLDADTHRTGEVTTVADITLGKVWSQETTAIAGVSNIGSDPNWCGHIFAQANWYAFGRLAWNPELTAEDIAREWLIQTFPEMGTPRTRGLTSALDMMMTSRETAVNYMMPLGLHHIFATADHYGPEPWSSIPGLRADWQPPYYHKADTAGIGFDRTASGSGNVKCYASPLSEQFDSPDTCPEELLLWFHHLPWTYKLKNGNTLWDEMCYRYQKGVDMVRDYQDKWYGLSRFVDKNRWLQVRDKLKIQEYDAVWWKDACLQYFGSFSGMPLPEGVEPFTSDLDSIKNSLLYLQNRPDWPRVGHIGNYRLEIVQ